MKMLHLPLSQKNPMPDLSGFFEGKIKEAQEDGWDSNFVERIRQYWDALRAFDIQTPRMGFGQPWAFSATWENDHAYAVLEFVEERIEFYFEGNVTHDEDFKTFEDFLNSKCLNALLDGFPARRLGDGRHIITEC